MLAQGCLSKETATLFMSFISNNLSKLVTPEQIIEAKNFKTEIYEPIRSVVQKGTLRVDILSTLATRLVNYLTTKEIRPNKDQLDNIKSFIKLDFLPNDIRLAMSQDLVQSSNSNLKMIMADPEIGKLLLKKM
jgi:hypothetical protein